MNAMHCGCVLLLCCAICVSGCAALIANSGVSVLELEDRETVQKKLGSPEVMGFTEGGMYEEYRTRRNLSDLPLAATYGLAFCFTLGLSEPLCLAIELSRLARNTVAGQDVRVNYDENDQVTGANYGAFGWTISAQ